MGISSIGIKLLFLPLCVNPLPQKLERISDMGLEKPPDLEMNALEVNVGMDQVYDLDLNMELSDSADVNPVKTKSDPIQSMALTCPPPVASFLRYQMQLICSFSLQRSHLSKFEPILIFSLDDQPYNVNSDYLHLAMKEVRSYNGRKMI